MEGSPTRSKIAGGGGGHGSQHHFQNMKTSQSVGKLGGKSKKLTPLEDGQNNALSSTNLTRSIQNKRDLIEAVRKTVPASVNTAPIIFWDVEAALKTTAIDDSEVKQQMNIVENGVNYNIKRYNDLKVLNDRLTKVLKQKLDELEYQKKTFEQLDSMKKSQTEEGIRIDNLHTEIGRCEEEIRDRTHYSRKLDHMLNRLKKNQLTYDAHMVGLEETMNAINKESADIRLMRRALDAGKAKAELVFEETQASLSGARKDRKILLEQREHEFENALTLELWLKERERMKLELGIELRGDLTVEDEKFLKTQIHAREEKNKSLIRESEECNKRLQAMEESFTRLKQVTGVKNVEEMHEKFSSQRANKFQLDLEVHDAKIRLEIVKNSSLKCENDFKSLKSSGVGLEEINRESIDLLDRMAHEARHEQKSITADSERIATVLLGLHQGAQGLLQRVQPYQQLIEGGVFDLTQVGEEASPWTETVEALNTAEHILSKMMEVIAGDNNAQNPGFEEEDDQDSQASGRDSESVETGLEAPNQANNVRIKSKKYWKLHELESDDGGGGIGGGGGAGGGGGLGGGLGGGGGGGGAAGGGGGGNNDDKEDGNDKDNGDGMMMNDGLLLLGGGGGGGGGMMMLPTIGADEDAKLSRLTLKSASSSLYQKETNRLDMEQRRKRLLERISNKSSGPENSAADDAKIGLTAKLKTQRASAERLSVMQKVPTLPEGVTLRDDPMTKTIAFLQADPGLT